MTLKINAQQASEKATRIYNELQAKKEAEFKAEVQTALDIICAAIEKAVSMGEFKVSLTYSGKKNMLDAMFEQKEANLVGNLKVINAAARELEAGGFTVKFIDSKVETEFSSLLITWPDPDDDSTK